MSGDLERKDVTPYPKAVQVAKARKPRNRNPKATAAKWAGIVAEKQGVCMMLDCEAPPPNDMHHAVPRDFGGPDVPENIVPVRRDHHRRITALEPAACALFVESLWFEAKEPGPRGGVKDTYSWAVDTFGEAIWERVYRIRFEAP